MSVQDLDQQNVELDLQAESEAWVGHWLLNCSGKYLYHKQIKNDLYTMLSDDTQMITN